MMKREFCYFLGTVAAFYALVTAPLFDFPQRNLASVEVSGIEPLLLTWTSEESKSRFVRSENIDFFPLANHFEAQVNKFYCGPASATIVMNALRLANPNVKKPHDLRLYRGVMTTLSKDYNPVFERYTQDTFFNAQTDKIKTQAQVFGAPMDAQKPELKDYGFQLRQMAAMLRVHDLNVEMRVVADNSDAKQIRDEIIGNLRRAKDFVIVNYSRKSLGQKKGDGHISPLASYDEVTDSVLILDVNPTYEPWVWVKLDDLIAAMRTKDTIENRGYLVISE